MKKMHNAIILAGLPEVSFVMGLGMSHEKYKKNNAQPSGETDGGQSPPTLILLLGGHCRESARVEKRRELLYGFSQQSEV